MVAVEEVEQALDVLLLEPADVVAVVDVARRGADQDQPVEPLRLPDGGEHADHGAHRMADEDDVRQVQLAADRQHVVGVAIERAVSRRIEGGGVGLPVPDMIEEDDLVAVLEGRRDEPPHVLVAAIAMGEDHGLLATAREP